MGGADTSASGPICIFGLPRSGTTWLGKIFDSHPMTRYRHEPDSGGALQAVPVHVDAEGEGAVADHMRAFLAQLPRQRQLKVCGKLPLFSKRFLPGWRGHLHRASVYAGKSAARWLSLPVLEPIHPGRGEPRLVWKSIESTGRAGLVAAAEPRSRVVLILRHPCGQIRSTLRGEADQRFTDDCPAADDWGIFALLLQTPQARRRGLTLERLQSATPEERLAWRWLLFNEKAMEDLQGRDNVRIVRYEDLCDRPGEVACNLFSFAGLDWDTATQAFIDSSTAADDPRYYSVYRDPMRAAAAWQHDLDPDTIERIAAVVEGSAPGKLFVGARRDNGRTEAS